MGALGVAGGRGSGKTSVSTLLAIRLNAKRASFGEYLRGEARRLGLEETIENLQDVGQRLVSTSPVKFVENVVQTSGWNGKEVLIIDGIRHLEILEALRSVLSPTQVRLILLKVDSEVRKKRLEHRGDDISNFERLDNAPTEVQIFSLLPRAADLVVDGSLSLDEIANKIIRTVSL